MVKFKIIAVLPVFLVPSAQSVEAFSRSCSIGEFRVLLPEPARTNTMLFLKAYSLMTAGEYSSIMGGGDVDFRAMESITADYWASPRYYLFARAEVWRLRTTSVGTSVWTIHSERNSAGWRSDQVDPDLAANPMISRNITNRGIWRSARAGHPSIFERVPARPNNNTVDIYYTFGHHYYVGRDELPVKMNATVAENCNISRWGFFSFF